MSPRWSRSSHAIPGALVAPALHVALVALALHATIAWSQVSAPGCPVDTAPLRVVARGVQNDGLRRELVRLTDNGVQDLIYAAGGRDRFDAYLSGRIAAFRRTRASAADGKTLADAESAIAVFEGMLKAAECVLPEADPREPLPREKAGPPVSAVGMVRRMLGQGTGTLVGRCIVVTNEHVVSRGGSITASPGDAATFYAGVGPLEGGFAEWVRAEIVAVGPRRTTNHLGDDWAILRLDRPLGDKYGTVATGAPDATALATQPLWALGFPGDGAAVAGGYRSLWSHKGCRAVMGEGNAWLVTCAGNRGQSGGPILMSTESGAQVLVAMMTAVRRAPPLGTQAAAQGNAQPLAIATAVQGFAPRLQEALAEPCPSEKAPPRLR